MTLTLTPAFMWNNTSSTRARCQVCEMRGRTHYIHVHMFYTVCLSIYPHTDRFLQIRRWNMMARVLSSIGPSVRQSSWITSVFSFLQGWVIRERQRERNRQQSSACVNSWNKRMEEAWNGRLQVLFIYAINN